MKLAQKDQGTSWSVEVIYQFIGLCICVDLLDSQTYVSYILYIGRNWALKWSPEVRLTT